MRRAPARRIAGATLALILAALCLPAVAGWRVSAHAQLVTSSPGAGEVLARAPDQLVLVFSEPLEEAFTSLDLTDADGAAVASDLGSVNRDDPFQLVADLPPLPDGVYQVQWQSLSAADGHTASGFFSFGVGDVSEVPAGGTGHGGFEPDAVATIGRWLGYLGLMAGFGLPIIAAVVLRQPPRAGILRLTAALMLLSAAATLALAIRASEVEGIDLDAYLFASRNGALQLARASVLAATGIAVFALAAHARAALWTAGVGSLVAIGLLAGAGHASALPGIGAVASQIVHVAAAAVWLTGVAMLAMVAVRPSLVTRQREPLVRCVPRFSAIALVSIGLMGVTGFFASWIQTGSLLDLTTDYGRVLLIKLVLAVAAIAIGGLNFLYGDRLTPRMLGLRHRLVAEVSLGVAVLLATGLLSTTSPTDTARGVAIAPVPDAFGAFVPGMSLELLPGRPGVNQVAVTSEGAMGTADFALLLDRLDQAGQTRIPLRHVSGGGAMPGMPGMSGIEHDASSEGPARFVADAVLLPAGSRWDANVVLRTAPDGSELVRQRFSFELDEAAVVRGQVASLVDVGLAIAALLAVGGALSIGLGLGGVRLPRCDATASRVALAAGGVVAVALGVVIGAQRLTALG